MHVLQLPIFTQLCIGKTFSWELHVLFNYDPVDKQFISYFFTFQILTFSFIIYF